MKIYVSPVIRFRFVRCLVDEHNYSLEDARSIDQHTNSVFPTQEGYVCKAKQVLHNLLSNPTLTSHVEDLIALTDSELAKGTILQKVEEHESKRESMLEQMLAQRVADNDVGSTDGPLRCRSCGSSSVAWDQKQTRGADEASTVSPSDTHTNVRTLLSTLFPLYAGRCFVSARSATHDGECRDAAE